MRPRFAIVMPVLNAIRYLPITVPAARAAADRYANAEIVIVDNGSTDGSYEFLSEVRDPRLKVIRHPDATISAVRNRGVLATDAELVAFIDADCVVGEDHLERSLEVFERTGCAATGSAYHLPDDPLWIERTWHRMHAGRDEGPVRHINGGNLVCRRNAFEKVGGFNEKLTTGEDAELCARLLTEGFALYGSKRIVAKHLGNPKSVGAFYRKQRWHALGSLGTWRLNRFDKPVLMTFAFVVLVLMGLVSPLIWGGWGIAWGLGLVMFVPLVATIYRAIETRSRPDLLRGTVLYFVYFSARASGILSVLRNRSLFEESASTRHGTRA